MSQHPHRVKQMARRKEQGATYRELGEEFDMSPAHICRLVNSTYSPVKNVVKNPSPQEYKEE
jgi:hypothetical protein